MSYTYAIADMHGRYDLFVAALKLIKSHAGDAPARLVVLGDFIDRGPDSRLLIEHLMSPMPSGWSLIVIQGNHEDIMLQAISKPAECLRWWVGNGGGETLKSYGYKQGDFITPLKVPVEHLEWLARLPIYFEDEHRIYVHGGVDSDLDMSSQSSDAMQWGLYSGEYPDSTQLADRPHVSGKHVVHGHHQSAAHPLLLPHRTNLDGFAWYTGDLAIGIFDDAIAGGPVKTLSARVSA